LHDVKVLLPAGERAVSLPQLLRAGPIYTMAAQKGTKMLSNAMAI